MEIREDLGPQKKRAALVLLAVLLALGALHLRLAQLQLVQGSTWRRLAENNRQRRIPLASPRGRIYDRRGVVLADNVHQQAEARLAGADAPADREIARLALGAGEHQVAEAGEAGEGLRPAAETAAEPRHLGQAARDQGRSSVGAVSQTIGNPRGYGQHVLDRAAELHADYVIAGVGAKLRTVKQFRYPLGVGGILRRDGHCRGQAASDLGGETGPRQRRDGRFARQLFEAVGTAA